MGWAGLARGRKGGERAVEAGVREEFSYDFPVEPIVHDRLYIHYSILLYGVKCKRYRNWPVGGRPVGAVSEAVRFERKLKRDKHLCKLLPKSFPACATRLRLGV